MLPDGSLDLLANLGAPQVLTLLPDTIQPPASGLGRVRSGAGTIMASLERMMVIGALVKLWVDAGWFDYPAAIALVALIDSFRTLHRAVRFSARGRQ
jgi:hypothetical protein